MVLPLNDGAWLITESHEAPQHVGALMVFSYPEGADDQWLNQLWQRFRQSTDFAPPFNYRLTRPNGIAGVFSWQETTDIDLDHHLQLTALPAPGRVRELFMLVSRLHSVLLDRTRPLWEIHLIEGLEDNRFAIYAKFHHSVFDGVGAMRIMLRMFSANPEQRNLPAPWETSSAAERPPDRENVLVVPRRPVLDLLRSGQSLATVFGALWRQFRDRRRGVEGAILPFSAPRSILNGHITGPRRFAADGWSFDRMVQVGRALDVSLNDVALAMCSHALRGYLLDQSELPAKPLTAMIPVSVRSDDEGAGGNALSFLVCDLGTHLAEPAARLQRIATSMGRGKARLSTMKDTERIGYALLIASPYLLGPLLGFAGKGRPVVNVVISNVPGTAEPRYLDGARLLGIYPASVLEQGQALNITFTSYNGEMQFGLTACRRTLPHVQRMLDHLDDGLVALEELAGITGGHRIRGGLADAG